MTAWLPGAILVFAWLLAVYQFRLLPVRSALAASYWSAFLLAAVSRIFKFPPIGTAIDSALEYPNVSQLLAGVCIISATLGVQSFVYLSLMPHRPRFRIASAVAGGVVLAATVALFFAAGSVPQNLSDQQYYGLPATLWAYRALYLAYLFLAAAVLTGVLTHYAVASQSARVRMGFGLMASGGVFALAHLVNDVGSLFPPSVRPLGWGDKWISDLLVPPFFLLVVAGALMPVWDRALSGIRAHVTFLRLRSFWRDLRDACPEVCLLPDRPLWKDILDPRDVHFRLHQQVAEIRDAGFILSAFSHPNAGAVAMEMAEASLGPDREAALREAVSLITGLERRRGGAPAHQNGTGAASSQSSLPDELAHLALVADYVTRSQLMNALRERLNLGEQKVTSDTKPGLLVE